MITTKDGTQIHYNTGVRDSQSFQSRAGASSARLGRTIVFFGPGRIRVTCP